VYAYNVQPGISIDCTTGDSASAGAEQNAAAVQPQPEVAEQSETTVQEEPPKGENYILNISTKEFYRPGCSSVGQMKESNKEEFIGNRDDVIARGYDPCKRCNP
jgi:DNA-entry nuclease